MNEEILKALKLGFSINFSPCYVGEILGGRVEYRVTISSGRLSESRLMHRELENDPHYGEFFRRELKGMIDQMFHEFYGSKEVTEDAAENNRD